MLNCLGKLMSQMHGITTARTCKLRYTTSLNVVNWRIFKMAHQNILLSKMLWKNASKILNIKKKKTLRKFWKHLSKMSQKNRQRALMVSTGNCWELFHDDQFLLLSIVVPILLVMRSEVQNLAHSRNFSVASVPGAQPDNSTMNEYIRCLPSGIKGRSVRC